MPETAWQQYQRDFWHQPLLMPLAYGLQRILTMERGGHFPFYITPSADGWGHQMDKLLVFMDHLVDAHEDERNKQDAFMDFYKRSIYVATNFHRYSNPTLGNLMFDTKAKGFEYDRVNSVLEQGITKHYLTMVGVHAFSFMYMTFFFRYRRIAAAPALAISLLYYQYWNLTH